MGTCKSCCMTLPPSLPSSVAVAPPPSAGNCDCCGPMDSSKKCLAHIAITSQRPDGSFSWLYLPQPEPVSINSIRLRRWHENRRAPQRNKDLVVQALNPPTAKELGETRYALIKEAQCVAGLRKMKIAKVVNRPQKGRSPTSGSSR